MNINDITPEIVKAVEKRVGLKKSSWGEADPRVVIAAAYEIVESTIGTPPISLVVQDPKMKKG